MGKDLAVKKGGGLSKAGDYRKELSKFAKDDSARLPSGGGQNISIRGKKFSFQGGVLEAPLKVVAVDYGFENALYEGKFDPESAQPPICFAVGRTTDEMAPHENSPKPQADNCRECPHNQFGTADVGRGKACKNSIRIAVLSTNVKKFDEAHIKKTEPAMIKLPPTSVKNFRGYLKQITEGLQLPLFSVITAFDFDQDTDLSYPVVVTQFEDEISDRKVLNALVEKRDAVQNVLLQPFDTSNYAEQRGGGKGKGKAKPAAKPARGGGKKPQVEKRSKF